MESTAARNRLIQDAMPRVFDIVRRKRAELGDAHVTECQRRGLAGEAGWFYAREGPLAVGRLWPEAWQAEQDAMPAGLAVAGTAFACIRPKGAP
jgi:hypothetical protein